MTSASTTGQQTTEGRSVRDIVEHEPDQVTEAWCRKIFRKLLQSLELQYAMQMPHRAITADTVVFHDNGEPLLLPSIISDPEPEQAGDLTALGRLIHYAITQELIPTGPLHGRGLAGYSDALIAAVDRCMDPDPARRPQTIDALRGMLGIVPPGALPAAPQPTAEMPELPELPELPDLPELPELPDLPEDPPVPAPQTQPSPQPEAQPQAQPQPLPPLRAASTIQPPAASADTPPAPSRNDTPHAPTGPRRPQRWTMAAGIAILLAVLLAAFAAMRGSDSLDRSAQTLPQDSAGQPQAGSSAAPTPPDGTGTGTDSAGTAALAASPDPAAGAATPATAQDASTPAQPASTPAAPAPAPSTPAAIPAATAKASVSYKLQIKPWGTVYVDGVDRGVSPPVKRLLLAPGRHTIRVTNPNFHDRTLDIDSAGGDGRIAVDFSDAPE